ncbi:unnamed protein product, partial [Gulo gulo]
RSHCLVLAGLYPSLVSDITPWGFRFPSLLYFKGLCLRERENKYKRLKASQIWYPRRDTKTS